MLSAVTKVITSTNGYCDLLWSSQKYIEKDQLWGAARLSVTICLKLHVTVDGYQSEVTARDIVQNIFMLKLIQP